MRKSFSYITLIAISLLCIQCNTKPDPFLITNQAVGELTAEVQIKQVDSILKNDSIVSLNKIKGAIGTQGEIEVYEKGGAKLLLVTPENEINPDATISNIQIFDPRYTTEKGLNVKSTFKDLKDNYEITNLETTISGVVIFIKDSPIYITIDKKQLPENLRYDPSIKVEASQIPDNATFKYFMIGWDTETPTNEDA